MEYKERLAHAMKLAGKDRQGLAVGVKISVQAISQALNGTTRALTAENSAKAARFLEVDAHWLATGEGEPRPPLMKERSGLSLQAVQLATAFDKLKPNERQVWQSLIEAAKAVAASDFSSQSEEMRGLRPGNASEDKSA